jgi:transposase
MPWTEITRRQYRRDGLRYASDLTDEEWQLIAPHLPPAKPLGRRRATDLRAALNAMLYLLTTGCQWRLLPKEFPPYTTVQRFFYGWRDDGTWRRINHYLLLDAREAAGREASPSAGVIDSQSVKTTEAGGPRGYDAGKKIKGRKRHILTDTTGLLVAAVVHEAGIQDRDGAVPLLGSIRTAFPWLRHVFADGGYAGAKLQTALAALGQWTLEIVKRSDDAQGFVVLPRRWVVERTLAWLNRNRRLAKDFEAMIDTATAWLMLASVKLLSRRLARG